MNFRADIFVKKLIQFIPKAALVKITFLTKKASFCKSKFTKDSKIKIVLKPLAKAKLLIVSKPLAKAKLLSIAKIKIVARPLAK